MGGNAIGWSDHDSQEMRKTFGPGAMVINKPTAFQIFSKEIFRPLYIFLIANLLIQLEIHYYTYCVVIIASAIGGITITIN